MSCRNVLATHSERTNVDTKKKIAVAACAAALLPAAGVAGRAALLMRRRPIEEFYEMRKKQGDFVPLQDFPERLVRFVLESEDSDFYSHGAYSWEGIRDAFTVNLKSGTISMGGSTITQQLVKNLYLRFNRSYMRKATELVLALEAERKLSKDEILELYLNVIYFGNGVYGIGDAARFYFGRESKDLTVNQMFMLSILPVLPTKGNPIQHPETFERFREKRLALFLDPRHSALTPEEAELIRSHHADCLDPDLREPDEFTDTYPQYPPLTNERFGPFPNEGYHNPMEAASGLECTELGGCR